jgi:hypothetical protein
VAISHSVLCLPAPLYILAALPSYVLSALLHTKAIFALRALCPAAKGQLISELLFVLLNFSKNQRKNLMNFCPRI